MNRNHRNALSLAAALVLTAAIATSASARGHIGSRAPAAAADSATGCLQKGDKAGTFKLVTKDGKTYDVTSKKVSLAGHVGHTVTLTGDTMTSSGGDVSGMSDTSKMSGMKMNDSSKMSGMGTKNSAMQVNSMTMVSATCS
jgi:hypothetical protein